VPTVPAAPRERHRTQRDGEYGGRDMQLNDRPCGKEWLK